MHSASGVSFEGLVASVSKDIRARSVLDEWVRLGGAGVDTEDYVQLRVEAFIPEKGFEEKAFYFGRNLREHIASAAHNLRGDDAPLFERGLYYEGLSPESASELESLSSELAMDVLQRVNRRAVALRERDESGLDRSMRISMGAFFYRAPSEDTGEE